MYFIPNFWVSQVFYPFFRYYFNMKKIVLAENLKICRQKSNMSQAQLANLVGVDQRTISNWENKVSEPSLEMLAKLCEIFDESFDGILT